MKISSNTFKQALARGEAQIGAWSTLPYPLVSELIGGAGYDWLLLDTEHTPSDPSNMVGLLQALGAATPAVGRPHTMAVVRPAWNDPVLIKKYLDIGAQTLLLPFVQSAHEAEAAVAATRYPPQGMRGMGGAMRASAFGRIVNYASEAAEEICVLVQAETMTAIDRIEEIASVPGVDGIFIGPADLSASMGYTGQPRHPKVTLVINDAIRRIQACGKAPGILMVDEQRAAECLEIGALFVAVAMDTVILRTGFDKAATRFTTDYAHTVGKKDY